MVWSAKIKNISRFCIINPIRFFWDRFVTPDSFKILLLSDGKEFTSEQQWQPFYTYRKLLRDNPGCVFRHALIDAKSIRLSSFDCIGIKFSFKKPKEEVLHFVKELSKLKNEKTSLVYFDGDDDLGIQHPEILPYVKLYIKKHLHADPKQYLKSYIGKSHLTHYVATTYNTSFSLDPIPCSYGLEEVNLGKLWAGWNLALDRKIQALYDQEKKQSHQEKTLDIVYRASIPNDWTRPLRLQPKEILQTLGSYFSVQVPEMPVAPSKYYEELRSSRLCISPFGYGEICWRDFEAVILRSLLLKPDVSHLVTVPNIFIPYETYIPLKWDYSDLEEKCRFYLGNEKERKRIVNNAYRKLSAYYENNKFIHQMQELISLLRKGV